MPRRSSVTPPDGVGTQPLKHGVWTDPAAPDGYIGHVVVSKSGERWLRIEIAQTKYSTEWIALLEHWLKHEDLGSIHIVT